MYSENRKQSSSRIRNAFKWWNKKKDTRNHQTFDYLSRIQTINSLGFSYPFAPPQPDAPASSTQMKYSVKHEENKGDVKIQSFFQNSLRTLDKSGDSANENASTAKEFSSVEDLTRRKKSFSLPLKPTELKNEYPYRSASSNNLPNDWMNCSNKTREEKTKQKGIAKVLGRFTGSLSNITKIGKSKKLKRSFRSHDNIACNVDGSLNDTNPETTHKNMKWKFPFSHNYDLASQENAESSEQNNVSGHYRTLSSPLVGDVNIFSPSVDQELSLSTTSNSKVASNEKLHQDSASSSQITICCANNPQHQPTKHEADFSSCQFNANKSNGKEANKYDDRIFPPEILYYNAREELYEEHMSDVFPIRAALRDDAGVMVNVSETNINFLSESSSSSEILWDCSDIKSHNLSLTPFRYHPPSITSDITDVTSITSYSSQSSPTPTDIMKEHSSPESIKIASESYDEIILSESKQRSNSNKTTRNNTNSLDCSTSPTCDTMQYLKKPATVTSKPSFGEMEREFHKFILEYQAKQKAREESHGTSKT